MIKQLIDSYFLFQGYFYMHLSRFLQSFFYYPNVIFLYRVTQFFLNTMSKSNKNNKNKSNFNQNVKLQHSFPTQEKIVKRQYKEDDLVFFDEDQQHQNKKSNAEKNIQSTHEQQTVKSEHNQHEDQKSKHPQKKHKGSKSKQPSKIGKSLHLRDEQEQHKSSSHITNNNNKNVVKQEQEEQQCKIDHYFTNDNEVKKQGKNYYDDFDFDIFDEEYFGIKRSETNQKENQKEKEKGKKTTVKSQQNQGDNSQKHHKTSIKDQYQKQTESLVKNQQQNDEQSYLDEDDFIQGINRQSRSRQHNKDSGIQEKQEDDDNHQTNNGESRSKKTSRISSKSKSKKQRKIRTTITLDKLNSMNSIFLQYYQKRQKGQPPQHNLKQIGSLLQLGYSTILHKYRQFRQQKKVKGGALIESLQRKRKYKKSKDIQNYINKALQLRGFYTAVQLSRYIYQTWGKNYSRSIISRHLGQMGFSYKNLKKKNVEPYSVQHPKVNMFKKIYAATILQKVKSKQRIMYLHQLHFLYDNNNKQIKIVNVNKADPKFYQNKQLITVTLICERNGLSFYRIHQGAYNKVQFMEQMKDFAKVAIPEQLDNPQIKKQEEQPNGDFFFLDITEFYQNQNTQNQKQVSTQIYLIMAKNQAHGDCPSHQFSLIKYLNSKGIQLIYLPPYIRKQGINVMQNWSKIIIGKFHQKAYHSQSWEDILDLGIPSAQKTFLDDLQAFLQQKKSEGLQKLYDDVESLLVRMEAIRVQ